MVYIFAIKQLTVLFLFFVAIVVIFVIFNSVIFPVNGSKTLLNHYPIVVVVTVVVKWSNDCFIVIVAKIKSL